MRGNVNVSFFHQRRRSTHTENHFSIATGCDNYSTLRQVISYWIAIIWFASFLHSITVFVITRGDCVILLRHRFIPFTSCFVRSSRSGKRKNLVEARRKLDIHAREKISLDSVIVETICEFRCAAEILKSSPFSSPRVELSLITCNDGSVIRTRPSLCRGRRSRRAARPFLAVAAANRLLHPSRGSHYGRGLKKGPSFSPSASFIWLIEVDR